MKNTLFKKAKLNKCIFIEVLIVVLGVLLSFCFYGCSIQVRPLPSGLFEQKAIFEKPDKITNAEEINKSYLKLFKAYQNNLLLLEYLEKMNNGK